LQNGLQIERAGDAREDPLLGLVRLAVDAGDLDTARRALTELEARRRDAAGVVDLETARARRERGTK
jgi:hypothetical protein